MEIPDPLLKSIKFLGGGGEMFAGLILILSGMNVSLQSFINLFINNYVGLPIKFKYYSPFVSGLFLH